MTGDFSNKTIKETIAFHGHSCPGLSIGIRVAEYVKKEFPHTPPAALVCVTETDMCGVDAIQYLTGCTFGKGNLIHRDYGKIAFSFYDRETKRGIRLRLRPECRGRDYPQLTGLMIKNSSETLSAKESQKLAELRDTLEKRLMSLPLTELFSVKEVQAVPPRPARILQSLTCEECGEQTMESRIRLFAGKNLCIPCYRKVEQKI